MFPCITDWQMDMFIAFLNGVVMVGYANYNDVDFLLFVSIETKAGFMNMWVN
jgi:hypothetical protein